MLRFSYNTIGCSNHTLSDALELISEAGYQGVTLTLDVHHMNPFEDGYERAAEALRGTLEAADLALVVDTGARFLLDPRERLEPSLLSPSEEGRARRLDFIRRAIRICEICSGEAVTFTAGRVKRNVGQANAGAWLLDGLSRIAETAAEAGVAVALEPEPGHIVGTVDDFTLVRDAARQMTDAPIHLALDTGHTFAAGVRAPHQAVKEFASILRAVSISDVARSAPHHVPLGTGEVDIAAVLAALQGIDFGGLVTVKVPRDSHRADELIPASIDRLLESLPSD